MNCKAVHEDRISSLMKIMFDCESVGRADSKKNDAKKTYLNLAILIES